MFQQFNSISTKDAMYLSESCKFILVLSKKLYDYEQTLVDEGLKNLFSETRTTLNNQYHQLMEVISNG